MNLTMNAKGALRCTKYISQICLRAHSSAKLNTWSAALCGAAARVSLHTTKERMMKNSTTTCCGALFMAVFALTAPCEIMRASFAKALESPSPLEPSNILSTSTSQATTVTGTQVSTPMSSPSGMRSPDRKRPIRKGSMTRTAAREIAPAATTATGATTVPATGGAAGNTNGNATPAAPVTAESAAALEGALALTQNADFRAWYESQHIFLAPRSRLQNLQFSLWTDDQACIAKREGDTKFLRADCTPMTIRISAKVNEAWADSFERYFGFPEHAIDSVAYRIGDGSQAAIEKAITETLAQHGIICSAQSIAPDHQWILDSSLAQVRDVANAVIDTYWSGQRGRPSARQRIEALTSFVQNAIPYRKVDDGRNDAVKDGKYRCGLRTPGEVLLDGGDCDSKSLLLATLIRSVDERTPVALVYCMNNTTPHMCLAVGCDMFEGEQRINVNGTQMVLIETTSDWDMGHVGASTDIVNAEAQPLR